jgi:hypothetical protein
LTTKSPGQERKSDSILRRKYLLTKVQERAAHADNWFKLYRANVRPLLPRLSNSSKRVKIAILDTGIDLEEDVVSSHHQRILKNESFLVDDSSTEDLDGHGTHTAGLILRVAPNAALYVARIAKSQKLLNKISIINVSSFNLQIFLSSLRLEILTIGLDTYSWI